MTERRTMRDGALKIVAPWMRGFVGSRFLTAHTVQLDRIGDAIVQGIGARLPEGPPPASGVPRTPEALPLIGRDRGILRGFAEADEAHIGRLNRWLDDWPRAGNPYALMEQVRGYLSPFEVRLRVVNDGNAWRTINEDGTKEYLLADPPNWDWSGEPEKVSRCWLIIYCNGDAAPWEPGPAVGDPDLWGGAIGTPGYTIGSTATPDQLRDLRTIIDDFKSGGAKYEAIVLAFDDMFGPSDPPGSPMPDGTWGVQTTTTGDPATAARSGEARYIRGF